jgi:hypothetical protein
MLVVCGAQREASRNLQFMEIYQYQATDFSDNTYKGYHTLEEAQEE